MIRPGLPTMDPAELDRYGSDPDSGFGALRTDIGNLPLRRLGVRAYLTGLTSRVVLSQRFRNPHAEPVEATYIFPLPDRAAVTAMHMIAEGRTVTADLREREQARRDYEAALAAGRRASIAEEERPDVFTLRVGNVLPGEEVTVELTVVGVLPVSDGAATFRFPLVVAPRYIPGKPLPGDAVGQGWQPDTDAVPDASRITPPVLLPGFPNPIELDVDIELNAGGLELGEPRSSLHAVRTDGNRIRFEPGARPDRDIVLRIPVGSAGPSAGLTLVPDEGGTGGTFELTVLPPGSAAAGVPRDVVLLLDRSGSMAGWKIVAARRAAARIVDTLTDRDRFAVLAFDNRVEFATTLSTDLADATDRNRFRAVEFLARLEARGGTELSEPLGRGLRLLASVPAETPADARRDRVLVLVTDGQVGNEDQLLAHHAAAIGSVRLHAVGIDQAVNAGFLGRLASLGGGRCELVESEDRLDEAMESIHRRIGSPLVVGVTIEADGLSVEPGSLTPRRLPDLFSGVPQVIRGRYVAAGDAAATLRGTTPDGHPFEARARGQVMRESAITAAWARARIRDLEDQYVSEVGGLEQLEREIVSVSLRFGVLSRFTAFVAVDDRVVTEGTAPRSIVQPVHLPAGWELAGPAESAGTARMQFASAMPFSSVGVSPPGAPRANALGVSAPAGAARAGLTGRDGRVGRTVDDVTLLRHLLATEAVRLRQLAEQPDHRRREALLDLGSRLSAVASGLRDARWRRLLELLTPQQLASAPLDETWAAVLALLAELADGSPGSPSHGPGPGSGRSARRGWWQRGGPGDDPRL